MDADRHNGSSSVSSAHMPCDFWKVLSDALRAMTERRQPELLLLLVHASVDGVEEHPYASRPLSRRDRRVAVPRLHLVPDV